jgi:hypothetical protein
MDVRRQTLVSNGPLGNAYGPSSLPVPSSAMKKPATRVFSGSRVSIAPGAGGMGGPSQNTTSLMPSGSQAAGTTMARSTSRDNVQGRASTALSSNGLHGRPSVATSRGDGPVASGNRGDGGMYGRTPSRPPPA